ncbi:hypothetical protein HA075_01030 [bacterium BFN5]|nr:hypothetical protein HA075_00660 [bacterium BFN5]QJW44548.1 hypothetical protein HA075_01030 [bacterium BFN5]
MMPTCKNCGNSYSFGSSAVPPSAPTANGLVSGIVGQFNHQSEVVSINSMGATKASIRQAVDNPQQYFDTCIRCGSQDINWNDSEQ